MIGMLVQQAVGGEARSILLPDRTTRIGRHESCDIVLNDKSVSRQHALLERRDSGYVLRDQNSHNGIRVNGVGVAQWFLRHGDQVSFGDVLFTFQETEEAPTSAERPRTDTARKGAATDPGLMAATFSFDTARSTAPRPHYEALNALQVIRLFESSRGSKLEEILQIICGNLAGIVSVKGVVIHLSPARSGAGAKFVWSTRDGVRQAGGCLEEKLLEVARTGHRAVVDEVKPKPHRPAGNAFCSAVYLPIRLAGKPGGCLYAEGDDLLSMEAAHTMETMAEAIGLGLSIWSPDHAAPTAAAPAPAARRAASSIQIVGRSKVLQEAVALARKAAVADSTVLLRGETGTGKELFARLIFSESTRRVNAFIPVHCSAIEETLLGSALFGHEKGAFTGAVAMKRGLFEDADQGTIFLDEIGELSASMQVKLLRVLQEGEFMRLGGNKTITVDVRVIAATNRNLEAAVKAGTFREDLYFRLKVIELTLPPLRARAGDIPDLVNHFIQDMGATIVTPARRISAEAMTALQGYPWPGNIRELGNVIERSLVLADGPELTLKDLPAELTGSAPARTSSAGMADSRKMSLEEVEARQIRRILDECGGNKSKAAQRLGISRSALYEKLKLLNIS
jgi:DNA-binding NtrC family response regulator